MRRFLFIINRIINTSVQNSLFYKQLLSFICILHLLMFLCKTPNCFCLFSWVVALQVLFTSFPKEESELIPGVESFFQVSFPEIFIFVFFYVCRCWSFLVWYMAMNGTVNVVQKIKACFFI